MPDGTESDPSDPVRSDPSDPAASEAALTAALIGGAVPIPGHRPGEPVRVRYLARGQSYDAWRVTAGSGDVLLRIPHRPADQAPRPMADEFAALARIPDGVGTRGLAYRDTDDNPLGRRYVLTTFVPGSVEPVTAWTTAHLDRLADALVRLHRVDEPLAGPVHAPSRSRVGLAGHLDASLGWWRHEHPRLFDDPEVDALLPAVLRFVRQAEAAGGAATRFSLIHGDLIAANVVLDGDRAGFIDWEWAELGDPAQDLAYIGGTVHGGPDYVPMDDEAVLRFVTRYVDGMRAAGKDTEDVPVLLARRDGWEVCERLLTMLHNTTRAATDPIARTAVAAVRATLRQRVAA